MKILHFFKTYYPDTVGGIEQTIKQIARASIQFGVQTDVLTLSPNPIPETIEMDGHRVHRAQISFQCASTPCSLSAFSHFAQLAKEADLIHYHYPWPFMDLVHFIMRIKKPTVLTYHSDIVRQKTLLKIYRPLKKQFLASVDRIVATSPNYIETSLILRQYPDKTQVIPIGLDKSTYPEVTSELVNKWSNTLGNGFFLFVGVLRYYKGLYILLNALKEKEYPVVIVGSGPIENELKSMAAQLNLRKIHFLGALHDKDKVALLKLCLAVVFPSHLRAEAFGVSLLEGAMYAKPMISTEIGTGTSYINIHNETGLIVPPGDPAAFSKAMQFLWENPSVAKKMGEQAGKRYLALFTAKQMASKYVGIYNDLLTN